MNPWGTLSLLPVSNVADEAIGPAVAGRNAVRAQQSDHPFYRNWRINQNNLTAQIKTAVQDHIDNVIAASLGQSNMPQGMNDMSQQMMDKMTIDVPKETKKLPAVATHQNPENPTFEDPRDGLIKGQFAWIRASHSMSLPIANSIRYNCDQLLILKDRVFKGKGIASDATKFEEHINLLMKTAQNAENTMNMLADARMQADTELRRQRLEHLIEYDPTEELIEP